METGSNIAVLQVACDILDYLSEHPSAQDSLEGIIAWWLLEQEIRRGTTVVKQALADLVDRELLVERKIQNSRTCYRLNQRRARDISSFLSQTRGHGH